MSESVRLNSVGVEVLELFFIGSFAPSQIDGLLSLKDGTAHDLVLWAWNHMGEAMLAVHGSGGRDIWQSSTIS